MFGKSDPSDDYQPFGYWGQVPLYATTLLVMVYAAAVVLLALLRAANVPLLPLYLDYNSIAVLGGLQFWRFVTYSFVNGPWFLITLVFFYWFGREVERFLGRKSFAALYAALLLLAPCVMTALGLWIPSRFAGGGDLTFGIFIAFVAIYPNVELFFTIKAKWIALGGITIVTLAALADHAFQDLLLFWMNCAAAWLFVKYLRGQLEFNFSPRDYFRMRRSRRSLKVMPPPRRAAAPRERSGPPEDDVIESIDPLLDKIAKTGLSSLTEREKEKLENARAALLKKGR